MFRLIIELLHGTYTLSNERPGGRLPAAWACFLYCVWAIWASASHANKRQTVLLEGRSRCEIKSFIRRTGCSEQFTHKLTCVYARVKWRIFGIIYRRPKGVYRLIYGQRLALAIYFLLINNKANTYNKYSARESERSSIMDCF